MSIVLVADCPWKFGDSLPGDTRGASKNYSVMSVDSICTMQLPLEIVAASDAWLFLWRVSAMVEEAYHVVRAWNFVPKSEIVWNKLSKNGLKHFGMGRSVRLSHETCIIATRGKPERKSASIRSTFEAQTPTKEDGTVWHSAKPDEFFKIVEELTYGPFIEMFARKYRTGWTCYGNELPEVKRGFGFKRSM